MCMYCQRWWTHKSLDYLNGAGDYILGSPKSGPAPVMRSCTGKPMPLESFISSRQKEQIPSNMLLINQCHRH